VTYEQLIAQCRRTLDLHPEHPIENLREFGSIVAHNIPKPSTAATYYAHLYYNLVEYIEQHREIESSAAPHSVSKESK
jgi:hypothetical protein